MKTERRYSVIDTETGEVINTIGDGDSVYRRESREAIEGKVINFNKGEAFIKAYDEGMRKIGNKLTNAQFAFICHLLPQIEYNTNILRNRDGTLMEIVDMSEYTGITYVPNYKMTRAMITMGIMGRWETGARDEKGKKLECLVMNPYIFHKGTMIPDGLLELFSKTGWDAD